MKPEMLFLLCVVLAVTLCFVIERAAKTPDFHRCPLCNQPESLVFRF
jgi:hypothetical protein